MSVTISVYSRRGCHLCELLLEELEPLLRGRGGVQVFDIDERAEWQVQFGARVPVVFIGERLICEGHLDRSAILREIDGANPPRQA